jgi:hypothetical protein
VFIPGVTTRPALLIDIFLRVFAWAEFKDVRVPVIKNEVSAKTKSFECFGEIISSHVSGLFAP